MIRFVALAATALALSLRGDRLQPAGDPYTVTDVATGLSTPWDLAWGPDGKIWFSERGGRISRLDPATGVHTLAGTIDVSQTGEGGVMGIAFQPDFAREP